MRKKLHSFILPPPPLLPWGPTKPTGGRGDNDGLGSDVSVFFWVRSSVGVHCCRIWPHLFDWTVEVLSGCHLLKNCNAPSDHAETSDCRPRGDFICGPGVGRGKFVWTCEIMLGTMLMYKRREMGPTIKWFEWNIHTPPPPPTTK